MKQRELHPCLDCGAAISGRWTRCKTCSNKARVRPAPEGMKVCGMCREPKPLADFTRCLRGAFGRGSVVLERDDGACGIWGGDVDPTDFHIDHVVALARGGPHAYSNVQIAHPFCNRAKGDGMPLGDALGLPKV
jgi:hypothetical protein